MTFPKKCIGCGFDDPIHADSCIGWKARCEELQSQFAAKEKEIAELELTLRNGKWWSLRLTTKC